MSMVTRHQIKRQTKRAWLGRQLAVLGLMLTTFLIASIWVAIFFIIAPARQALANADSRLAELDSKLAHTQKVLEPLDVLSKPQTQDAVKALHTIAKKAQKTSLLGLVFAPETLNNAVLLTQQWELSVGGRPPLPAVQEARSSVGEWRIHLANWHQQLEWWVWGMGSVLTLLCVWFGLGQWALYRITVR